MTNVDFKNINKLYKIKSITNTPDNKIKLIYIFIIFLIFNYLYF